MIRITAILMQYNVNTVRCQIDVLTVKLKAKNNACFQHFHYYTAPRLL